MLKGKAVFYDENGLKLGNDCFLEGESSEELRKKVEQLIPQVEALSNRKVSKAGIKLYEQYMTTKTYKVPVVFQSWGLVSVEAENKEDLLRKLKDSDFVAAMPLPEDPQYLQDSYEIDFESDLLMMDETP